MRLFTAVDIPESIREALTVTVRQLKPSAPSLRWSKPANLHITTKFLGEVPAERLADLNRILREIESPGEISIEIRGLGWFPNPHSPRILYAGIHAPEALELLHRRTDEALETAGVPRETKPFRPHLTLARIEPRTQLADLRHAIFRLPTNDFGSFTATAFHLYESRTLPSGSVYTKRSDVPL